MSSWIDTREVQSERANLTILFDKYIPILLEQMKLRFKKITPIVDIAHIQVQIGLIINITVSIKIWFIFH